MGFYIKYQTHQDGPYDLVTMIRKIRKGLIPPETLVMEANDPQAQSARMHPQLHGFFAELETGFVSDTATNVVEHLRFKDIMKYGWSHFMHNMMSGLIAAFILFAILMWTITVFIISQGAILPAILISASGAVFFLCGFIFSLQRQQRLLPFSLNALAKYYAANASNIILFCLAFALIHIAGFLFFIIPGFIVLSYLAFAPLLIVDRNFHFWHAIESSYRTVRQHQSNLFFTLLALIGINALATIFIFPLVITLPITFIGVIELYNQLEFD